MKLILLLLKKDDGIQRQESPGASASFHRLAAKVAIILQKTILNFFIFSFNFIKSFKSGQDCNRWIIYNVDVLLVI